MIKIIFFKILKREMDFLFTTAQNNAIRTNRTASVDETVNHVISECNKLVHKD